MSAEDRQVMQTRIAEAEKKENEKKRTARKKRARQFLKDFRTFITKGNVIDLAVAVVIGQAFNKIVNGLVTYIITPCISKLTGTVDFTKHWYTPLEKPVFDEAGELTSLAIRWGAWLQTILDFLVIALSIFVALRLLLRAKRKLTEKEEEQKKAAAEKKAAEEKAQAAAAAAQAKVKAEQEALFYRQIAEQTECLRKICEQLEHSSSAPQ